MLSAAFNPERLLKVRGYDTYLPTLDSGINIGVGLLTYGFFSRGYGLFKESNPLKKSENLLFDVVGYVFPRGYVYCFCQIFQGLCLFKGVRLFRSLE